MKQLLIISILMCGVLHCNAQDNKIKRAEKLMDLAAYAEAIDYYDAILEQGVDSTLIAKNVAKAYYELRDPKGGEEWFAVVVKNDPEPLDYFNYAQVLKSNGKYSEAQNFMSEYQKLNSSDPISNEHLTNENYYADLSKESRRYDIMNEHIDSSAFEFSPTYYGENLVFCSDSKIETGAVKRENKTTNRPFVNLYQAQISSTGDLDQIRLLSENLTSVYHEGPATFNKKLDEIYFTRSNVIDNKKMKASDNQIKLQIFHSHRTDTGWSEPEEFIHNNPEYSVGHPALSADGNTMYFVSDKKGGHGKTDIWMCQMVDGTWSEPENLGSRFNTAGEEMFPFIHEDGTLYFSSDGLLGLGGLDVFECRPTDYGFKSPQNLKDPINTKKDDFGYTLNKEKNAGFISSNRKPEQKTDDIYFFNRALKLSLLISGEIVHEDFGIDLSENTQVRAIDKNGNVIDQQSIGADRKFNLEIDSKYEEFTFQTNDGTGWMDHSANDKLSNLSEDETYIGEVDLGNMPIKSYLISYEGALMADDSSLLLRGYNVSVMNKMTGAETVSQIGEDGKVSLKLDPETDYDVTFRKEGWLTQVKSFNSSTISSGESTVEKIMSFNATKIQVGITLAIENILYDYNQADIRTDAAKILDDLIKVLELNPDIKIEIGSHTDSRGGNGFNNRLSQKRAKSAMKYLTDRGISKKRLEWKGYGESTLKNKCGNKSDCDDKLHEENRRTEFVIIAVK